MDIRSQSRVVGEIPSYVVRIVVDDDVIADPIPAAAVGQIIGCNAPVPPVEPEAAWSATDQTPPVCRSKSAREAAMLPRVIQVIVRIIATRVVTDPFIARVHVWSIGMTRLVIEVPLRLCFHITLMGLWCGAGCPVIRSRSVRRRRRRLIVFLLVLSERW